MNLQGKTAIVTGAARGIGAVIAQKLAQKGANVVLNDLRISEEMQQLGQELEKSGVRIMLAAADISNFAEAQELVNKAKEEFGAIDILVNNAGITRDNLIMRMSEEDFDKVIAVNLKGAFNCARHVAPLMLRQKSGRIINISSVVGIYGNAGQANYAASKAGIIGLTKSLAKEIGSRGITVNAIAPGFIETEMTAVLPEKVRQELQERITLRRLGQPEDIADAVCFLASDMAKYITGQVLGVDGGMAF